MKIEKKKFYITRTNRKKNGRLVCYTDVKYGFVINDEFGIDLRDDGFYWVTDIKTGAAFGCQERNVMQAYIMAKMIKNEHAKQLDSFCNIPEVKEMICEIERKYKEDENGY